MTNALADETELDRLCATVPFHDAEPDRRAAILRRLADTELHAALEAEPAGDRAQLRMFDLPGGPVALAADDAAALAGFLGQAVAHVSLPGRVLARTLAEAGHGLLVNPGRRSEMLLDAAALGWLVAALAPAPDAADAAPRRLTAPAPEALAALAGPLAARLGDMAGMVAGAALVGVEWRDGRRGHLVVVAGAGAADRPAIAKALSELIAFAPPVEGGTDVTFETLPLPAGAVTITAEAAPEPDAAALDTTASDAAGSNTAPPPRLRW